MDFENEYGIDGSNRLPVDKKPKYIRIIIVYLYTMKIKPISSESLIKNWLNCSKSNADFAFKSGQVSLGSVEKKIKLFKR